MTNEEWLKKVTEVQEEHLNKLTELMERSEARIDRTNEMVCQLANSAIQAQELVKSLTNEYTKHLGDLSECRNALLRQNETLLKLHENDIAEERELRAEVRSDHDRIFGLIEKFYTTSRGVKIENNFDDKK